MTWDEVYNSAGKLIKLKASRRGDDDHYALNFQDLVGEGWLAFSLLLDEFGKKGKDDPEEFIKMFHSKLEFHFRKLYRDHNRQRRKDGPKAETVVAEAYHVVDMTDIFDLIGGEGFEEAMMAEYIREIRSLISHDPELVVLFDVLIDTPKEVEDIAMESYTRKMHLHRQGFDVRGISTVAPTDSHIAKFLGWTYNKFHKKQKRLQAIVQDVVNEYFSGQSMRTMGYRIPA